MIWELLSANGQWLKLILTLAVQLQSNLPVGQCKSSPDDPAVRGKFRRVGAGDLLRLAMFFSH